MATLAGLVRKYYTEGNAQRRKVVGALVNAGVNVRNPHYAPLDCEVCGGGVYIEALKQPPTAAFSVEFGQGEVLRAEVRGAKGHAPSVLLWVDNPLCAGEKVLWASDPSGENTTGCTCDW